MRFSRLLLWAGLLGATGVGLGAFGAHALKPQLLASGRLEIWQTAVHYHLLHAVALLAAALGGAALPAASSRWIQRAGLCWAVGVGLFSGSLYWLALGGPRWLGPITPLGGLAMILGWVLVAVPAFAKGDDTTH